MPDARLLTLRALQRHAAGRAFADSILHELLATAGCSPADRGLLNELFYGILRNRSALDFLIGRLREGTLDDRARDVLRLGLYQLFWLNTPPHAAVNETVEVAGKARGLANAILRRAAREKEALAAALATQPFPTRFSHPEFLVDRWQRRWGSADTEALLRWNNTPAPILVRANTLRATPAQLLAAAPDAAPHPFHPLAIAPASLPSDWLEDGLCYVQDPSTLVAVDLLDPQPGERVLDACAAPGGKTTYIAAKMENRGALVAADSEAERMEPLKANLQRSGATIAELRTVNWTRRMPEEIGLFDRILVDAPCSNTGVLRRRADARWRLRPADFPRMAERQFAILRAVAPLLREGGILVYSTCSLEPEENLDVVAAAESALPWLRRESTREILPFRDGVDGAFAARWRRE